ncbi:hypothetical protein [Corallococcus exiguus]|uniref:hypothetical protein n=1 Tax=Corallococcus exiguus TaxID=83462 RepID=UPI00147251FC|nr:hypothetical protein [Corallococcus exiguus]NNB90521.1 hypothetical protein [Corallococcus exiguus]
MHVLNWVGPDIEARVYWGRGGPSALQAAVQAGELSVPDALRLGRQMPLLALEDTVMRVGFERFHDSELDPLLMETKLAVLADESEVMEVRKLLLKRWMQLRWAAHGQHSLEVSESLARAARSTALTGDNCDDATVRERTLHVLVPHVAAITLPDGRGRDWPVTDMLIASEDGGQQLRVLLEAPGDAPDRQTIAAIRMDWPTGMSIGEALEQHEKEAVPGIDSRTVWRWILGILLARQPMRASA